MSFQEGKSNGLVSLLVTLQGYLLGNQEFLLVTLSVTQATKWYLVLTWDPPFLFGGGWCIHGLWDGRFLRGCVVDPWRVDKSSLCIVTSSVAYTPRVSFSHSYLCWTCFFRRSLRVRFLSLVHLAV